MASVSVSQNYGGMASVSHCKRGMVFVPVASSEVGVASVSVSINDGGMASVSARPNEDDGRGLYTHQSQ